MAHWAAATPAAARALPISRRTAAMAATQGVYSSVNTKNTVAVNGVNSVPSAAVSPPSSTVSVETTLSLAVNPVISAVETRQSAKPSGANSGAIHDPTIASKLLSGVAATFRRASKVCKNQITTVATKMMVNARCTKSLALSQISCPTLRALGRR